MGRRRSIGESRHGGFLDDVSDHITAGSQVAVFPLQEERSQEVEQEQEQEQEEQGTGGRGGDFLQLRDPSLHL